MFDWPVIDLIIFDCDGVLVDSEPISNQILAEQATALGWPMSREKSQSIFKGMTMHQVHETIETHLGHSLDPDWLEDYYAQTYARFETELKAVPGVENLIQRALKAGKKICVASQGSHEKMAITLRVTGLAHHFTDRIFSAKDVPRPKPFPDLFLHAAETLAVKPQRCCVIEDSLTGVKAARAADMKVVHYMYPDAPPSQNETNMITVYQMDDILP